ncbi:Uu.00g007750.m01.CDS01 [Anthostomella pinea]|uniref:Uu.00g007750.m01.CDS01 n=1 Tax=Anthostomella pinea TaxID=933095 RepID=A0AAI8VRB7_9PEZI|nr:Uu.00g007750.m01.CDS01 [Anthostomella pinea]
MTGFLIPPWFVYTEPSALDMNVASIIWGVSLASAVFTAAKAYRQTSTIWNRKKGINGYVAAIWLELVMSVIMSIVSWLYLWGAVESSFPLFFIILVLWCFQTQCVIQIIINRIALLMRDQRKVNRMKWGFGLGLGLVNISVFCVWLPARLQISKTYINVNEVWDRVEKVIFCLIDASLNLYFIYLVRSKLISNGLAKYNRVFRFNLAIIACSVSLDVILIGVMSLGQGFIYVQFHPLVYLLKLHIELNMADLIAKVVSSENGGSHPSGSGDVYHRSHGTGKADPRGFHMNTLVTANRQFAHDHDDDNEVDLNARPKGGIQKTVETEVRHMDDDNASQSSTSELQKSHDYIAGA